MGFNVIEGKTFYNVLKYGFANLAKHFQAINDLNVFPVPDGDTGTNMKLTFTNGMKAITGDEDIGEMSVKLARGMLFGARGNSGVLTSQYFKGLSESIKDKKEVSVREFADAMVLAYKTAYSATVDPTEGTLLTVAREGIENTLVNIDDNTTYASLMSMVVQAMRISLDNTPNLLSVLKDAGVIDSGGKGLLTIFEGFLKFFTGEDIDADTSFEEVHGSNLNTSIDYSAFNENSVLDYGYCTEFLLQLLTSKIDISKFSIQDFISKLQGLGNSIVCFQTGTIVKLHIHTKKPYEVIEFAQNFGEFVSFKMENMALQHNEVVANESKKKEERKKYAIISIAQGDGIIETFKDLGSDIVLNGGPTMNTSAAEMIDAFKQANADEIILLPNETNILMAAHQAAELYKDSNVRVVETKTIPDGYNALSMILGGEESADECYESMIKSFEGFNSGLITKCARDTLLDGIKCKKDQYIGGINKHLVTCKEDRTEAFLDMLAHVEDIEDKEILAIFYGNMVREDEANELVEAINERFPNLEVGLISGKQDVYDFLLGIN